MRLSYVVFLAASMAVATCHGVIIDASNEGANWTVAPGDDLHAFVLLKREAGDPAMYGCDLEMMITGDGILPILKSIDMKAGSAVFAAGTQYPILVSGVGTPHMAASIDLNGDTTTAQGLLANLVIDTTGVAPGIYTLAAVSDSDEGARAGTHIYDAIPEDIPITYISGTITVTPEPSTFVLGGIAALLLWAFRRVRRPSRTLP